MYLKGVFLVMCLSCCTRPTYSPLLVVMALAPIPTLMTHDYIVTFLLICVSPAPQSWCRASASLYRWMCSNQLKLNTDKTDFILIGTRQQIEK